MAGIKDGKLSEELQLQPTLTLDSCITKVQQSESIKKQQGIVRGDRSDKITIEAVKTCKQWQVIKVNSQATQL